LKGVAVLAKIITITNQKGGTGKTTTSSALVAGLNQRNARVLGVDLDPQGNLGFSLGLELSDDSPTIFDVLKGTADIDSAIVSTEYGDVLPSDITLSAAEVEFSAPRREFLLAQQLNSVRSDYDFIIIDTPPSLSLLTVNAYVASDALIVPMEAEILSLVGITQLKETIEAVRDSFNPHLEVLGILLNKYNPRLTLSKDVTEMAQQVAQQLGCPVLTPKIRRSVGVAAAPAYGQSVITYKPNSKPAQDFQQVVDLVAGSRFPLVES
jgi:chromosome partitioning protein